MLGVKERRREGRGKGGREEKREGRKEREREGSEGGQKVEIGEYRGEK